MSLYRFALKLLGPLIWVVFRPKAKGSEKVPPKEKGVLICNHLRWWDPVVLALTLPQCHIHFMAKAELFKNPIAGWFLRKFDCIPVDRSKMDYAAIRSAVKVIKDGGLLGIFPEGMRSRTKELLVFEEGAAFLALRCECTVYPAHLDTKDYKGRRMLTYGDPIDVNAIGTDLPREERLALVTERMRDEVNALRQEQLRLRLGDGRK